MSTHSHTQTHSHRPHLGHWPEKKQPKNIEATSLGQVTSPLGGWNDHLSWRNPTSSQVFLVWRHGKLELYMLRQSLADVFCSLCLAETEIQTHSHVYESETNFFSRITFPVCTHRCDLVTLTQCLYSPLIYNQLWRLGEAGRNGEVQTLQLMDFKSSHSLKGAVIQSGCHNL